MAPAVEHLRPERRIARPLRWVFVALAAYNAVAAGTAGTAGAAGAARAAGDAAWVRAAVWGVLAVGFLALQLKPLRAGTRVEAAGVRAGCTWRWGRLVAWGDVEQVRVQGPYDDASRLRVRGRRRELRLPGMAADDVRALVAAHGLPMRDPVEVRRAASSSPPGDPARPGEAGDISEASEAAEASMEGPFRRSGTRPPLT